MKTYFDTNVLIAGALRNHPHHFGAAAILQRVRAGEIDAYIAADGLAEFYTVLTRMPITPPVYPSEVWQILDQNVLPHFEVLSLSGKQYKEILRECAGAGWIGGRVYDVLHLAAARYARCDEIRTMNVRHFRELAPDLAEKIRAV